VSFVLLVRAPEGATAPLSTRVSDNLPSLPLSSRKSDRVVGSPTRLTRAARRSAALCFQTVAASGGSRPTAGWRRGLNNDVRQLTDFGAPPLLGLAHRGQRPGL
jgi:hypothetical protein